METASPKSFIALSTTLILLSKQFWEGERKLSHKGDQILESYSPETSSTKSRLNKQGSDRCLLTVICVTKRLAGFGQAAEKGSPSAANSRLRIELHFCCWQISWANLTAVSHFL